MLSCFFGKIQFFEILFEALNDEECAIEYGNEIKFAFFYESLITIL